MVELGLDEDELKEEKLALEFYEPTTLDGEEE